MDKSLVVQPKMNCNVLDGPAGGNSRGYPVARKAYSLLSKSLISLSHVLVSLLHPDPHHAFS